MKSDYIALKSLEQHNGFKVLQALWIHQLTKIEEARDSAAKRGNETAWRYWAGQEKGFKLAVTHLQVALKEMEDSGDNEKDEGNFETLMAELRGETK